MTVLCICIMLFLSWLIIRQYISYCESYIAYRHDTWEMRGYDRPFKDGTRIVWDSKQKKYVRRSLRESEGLFSDV